MKDLPKETMPMECKNFLSELEGLPAVSQEDFLAHLPQPLRDHAAHCVGCRQALTDFADTREALAGMRAHLAAPGPWFATRVMQAISAKEAEIQERKNSVWISVRRFAPRLAAFATLLLVVGGTWALQLHRAQQHAQQVQLPRVESLFESAPVVPANDDIVMGAAEEQQP